MIRRKLDTIDDEDLNRLFFIQLILNGTMISIHEDIVERLKGYNLYKFDIKKDVNALKDKLKKNPKINWGEVDKDLMLRSGDMMEAIEAFCRKTLGIDGGYGMIQFTDFRVGDEVNTEYGKGIVEQVLIDSILKESTHSEVICYKVRIQEGEKKGKLVKILGK